MQAEYKMETEKNYMILEAQQTEQFFSTQMLFENHISGLINFESRCFNGENKFFYDITGRHSLKEYTRKEMLRAKEIRKLLQNLYCAVVELHSHFLDAGGLLMNAEYIFRDEKGFCFCYYPPQESVSPEEKLKILAEQLLEMSDNEDEDTIELIYHFYKIVIESEKGIVRILEEVLTQEKNITEEIIPIEIEEAIPEKAIENKFYRDTSTVICFFMAFIVSLCYLIFYTFPHVPQTWTEVIACIFVFISLLGIAMGFVDIERKK